MICVSIARGRSEKLLEEHQGLVEQGAQLVEWRVDFLNSMSKIEEMIANRPGPIVFTYRREQDGGKYRGPEDERMRALRVAIAAGVEYVDIEEDIAENIPRYGTTKRILSYHNFRETPENLTEIRDRIAEYDPDIIKMATFAYAPNDNLRMLEAVQTAKVPTSGFCMGDIGIPSRVLTGLFGSPLTYATFSKERTVAPGQLNFDEMKNLYGYDDINSETEVYGVIGDPIMHSYSPLLHNAAFRDLKLNKVYLPFRIPEDNLNEFLEQANRYNLKGLSVTIPHKETVLPFLTQADPLVKSAQAANTILWKEDQRLGFNTDISAAIESLETVAPHSSEDDKSPFYGKRVLILGTGGAAKALAYGLKDLGAEVIICGRTKEKVVELAERLKCEHIEWSARGRMKVQVLINCTPVGMHPNVDESPMEKHDLKPATIVFDTVYNPESTLLIKYARAQNCKTVTGIEMFVRQAAAQFKMFTNQEPPMELMRETLRKAIAPVNLS